MDKNSITSFFIDNNIAFSQNESMSLHTTFKIGGKADFWVEVDSPETLINISDFCKANAVPLTVLGKGSNVLVSDDGIEGIVITLSGLNEITLDNNTITCGAGVPLTALCNFALQHSLSGLEFAFGIPGSIGGAVLMNAGAYGGEIKDVIASATYLDKSGNIVTIDRDDMKLSYRTSIFKENGGIILSAQFKLIPENTASISEKMTDFMSRRRSKQPLEYPSAGSTFKRPEGYFAGTLIEQNNLKGYRIGGAMVSVKHAGFVINFDNATALDVKNLIEHIKNTVSKNNGVTLCPEVIFIGR